MIKLLFEVVRELRGVVKREVDRLRQEQEDQESDLLVIETGQFG